MTNNVSPAPIAHRPLILIACMLAMFMSAIEATIVATAMPTIIGDLGGFSLLGVRGLFAGAGDHHPHLRPLGGSLRPQAGVLLRRYAVPAGIGAVRLRPRHVLADRLPSAARVGRRRHHADRLHHHRRHLQRHRAAEGDGLPVERMGRVGDHRPLLGAFIVQHLPWALVFWVNLPIGLLAMFFLWRYLPAYQQLRRHALDLAGTARLTLFVSALLLALLQMESTWWWWRCCSRWRRRRWRCLSAGAARGRTAVPLALWQSRVIVAGNIGGLVIGAAMMGISAFLPTFIQGVMGGSPLEAGTTLALMSIGWPLASTLSGRLMLMTSYRATALLGALLLVAGGLILLMLQPNGGLLWGRVAAFMVGAGMGLCNTTF